MMRNYEVVYELSTNPNPTPTECFQSRSDVSNLRMVVQARDPNQARAIVEGMFGGPRLCRTSSAYPL